MIQKESCLLIADNSGAKLAKCISLINKAKSASICSLVLVTIKKFNKGKNKVKKKSIYLGIIVTTKFWHFRRDGFFIKFFINKIVVFNLQFKFLGTRVHGLINKNFKIRPFTYSRVKFFHKLISYSILSI